MDESVEIYSGAKTLVPAVWLADLYEGFLPSNSG